MRTSSETTRITVACASCGATVAITCDGLAGVDAYPLYSQYECPHCLKTGAAKTPGHIVTVSPN